MQHLSQILSEESVYYIIIGVLMTTLMTMFVYIEGRLDGRIDVASGQWQCEKLIHVREIEWECQKNED